MIKDAIKIILKAYLGNNHTLNKKIRKRKINLIIPKGCCHNIIFPNYNNLGYNLIIPKNNDCDIIIPNI